MASILVQFQLNDQQPIEAVLPPQFTLEDFKRAVDAIHNNKSFLYSFICHGKEFDLSNEAEFNQYRPLITSGTTVFVIEYTKSCFLPDTLVQRGDQTEICIKDVRPGDTLLAFTDSGEINTTVAENVFKHEVDEYLEIQLGERRLCATGEHPFFVGNGQFTSLDQLRISDCIYTLDSPNNLYSTVITNINTIKAPATIVYNLSTKHPHTYFANKIAVHNKFGKLFVDPQDLDTLKRIEWSVNGPNWRIARPGICIEGTCLNRSCKAYRQLVIINIGIKEFSLLTESYKISKCPECSGYVEPKTCAFNNCLWAWKGIMQSLDDSAPKELSGDWKKADDAYYRFDENENKKSKWLQLIFYAKAKG